MEHTRQNIGILGESVAAEYLKRNGYAVLERNYRSGRGELDIVCKKGRVLHFIEVKAILYSSRRELERDVSYGTFNIMERIDVEKIKNLIKTIMRYCAARNFQGTYQIDALFAYVVPHETYSAVDFIEDIGPEITKGDDWEEFI